jgi:signal transduction histidine kinase
MVGAMLGVIVRVGLDVPWREAMIFGLPLGLVAVPLSMPAWYLCRALPLARTPPLRLAIVASAAALTMAVVWAAASWWWWKGLGAMGLSTGDVAGPALLTPVIGLGMLAYLVALSVHYMLGALEDSVEAGRRVLESRIAQRDAELTALRAQVDPHFLFNSLNSISGLIVPDPAKARQMCQSLAEFLRDCLALGASARITLGREIALAEQYLRVEQVRFGRRLTIETSVTADSAEVAVPPLILQPLVENAVRHGIATCLEGGRIEITARRVGERAVVTVVNPRDVDGARAGTGFGLGIVRRRLSASFGDLAALVLEPADATYRATVTMPVDEVRRG